ncbi:hypothetical protein FRC01_000185, partial [Tulasnella sp. 417]
MPWMSLGTNWMSNLREFNPPRQIRHDPTVFLNAALNVGPSAITLFLVNHSTPLPTLKSSTEQTADMIPRGSSVCKEAVCHLSHADDQPERMKI